MPALKNPRWESFCQHVIKLTCGDKSAAFTQYKAYEMAGFKARGEGARVNAHRLLRLQQSVIDRIAELRAEVAREAKESLESVIEELNDTAQEAKADRAHGPRISAISTKAKLLGLEVQRVEQGKPGEFTTANAQSAEEFVKAVLGKYVPQDTIRADQIEAGKAEMHRHSQAIRAIAQMPLTDDAVGLTKATSDSRIHRH
jgi:hypothetical protein